jgi:hypothetical protein
MSDSTAEANTSLSLLTPTETKALWSFLSQADKADVLAPEWGIFANRPELAARTREGKEELTRATRSLISIDDNSLTGRHDQADTREHVLPPQLQHGQAYKTPNNAHLTQLQERETNPSISPVQENANASFRPSSSYAHHRHTSFSNDVRYDAHGAPSSSSSNNPVTPLAPESSSSTSALPYQNHSRKRLSQDQAPKIHTSHKRARKFSPSPASVPKSGSDNGLPHPLTIAVPSSSSSSSLDATAGQPLSAASHVQPTLVASPSSASEPPWSAVSVPASHSLPDPLSSSQEPYRPQHHHGPERTSHSAKPPLLTTSQKKANHIQSEQKRRANIRRGYEALCEIVPALREAIKAEEEAERLAVAELDIPTPAGETHGALGGGAMTSAADVNAAAIARKKARGKAVAAAFGIEEGEKVDGRAGPRSEAVVLQKSTYFLMGYVFILRFSRRIWS